jgi:hypothetical protein
MTPNIPNLDKLIAHLEAQPPERINMGYVDVAPHGSCGTCGCIAGHAALLEGKVSYEMPSPELGEFLGLQPDDYIALAAPRAWFEESEGVRRYPAHRVIATLKRLRDRFLATGEIIVDWGAEPSAGDPWTAPRAIEITPPALPETLTRLLAAQPAPTATEA